MTPTPSGRLRGTDLILTRTFRAPIEDVWTSVTDPESTARWFGAGNGHRDHRKRRIVITQIGGWRSERSDADGGGLLGRVGVVLRAAA